MSTSPGNRRWGIIVLLIIDYFVMFVARSSMSMCGPALMHEYGWTAIQFGWVSTAFFIGYAITMLPAGLLADRFGGGIVLVTGTLWWVVFTFLTPLGSTLGIMMLLRILVGVGQGLLVPANFSLAARWVPKSESRKWIIASTVRSLRIFRRGRPLLTWNHPLRKRRQGAI